MGDSMSRATNFVKATYQEVFDLSTNSDGVTVIGIHTPTTVNVHQMLGGFFAQYRKFRYAGCSAVMIPAAQLPADPLQVSWDAGETIDPRDLLNPILFHGAHGSSLNDALDVVFAKTSGGRFSTPSITQDVRMMGDDSDVDSEASYYAALSDPSFRKFAVQQGVKVSLRPMVHPLAMTSPIVPNAGRTESTIMSGQTPVPMQTLGSKSGHVEQVEDHNDAYGFMNLGGLVKIPSESLGGPTLQAMDMAMFTNGLRPLGWLPTVQFAPPDNYNGGDSDTNFAVRGYVLLPKLFMGVLILPPSYKTQLYFRMILTHTFYFKDFSTSLVGAGPMFTGPPDSYFENLPDSAGVTSSSLDVQSGTVKLTTAGVF